MKKILYLCMPFAAVNWPSLALSTLKAICQRSAIGADIAYLNLPFAAALGETRYDRLRELIDAEICFTCALFPELDAPKLWERYLSLYRGDLWAERLRVLQEEFLTIVGQHVPQLLKNALADIPWDEYDIVGFTTGYHQLTSSLALARLIRSRYPDKIMILGGASCESEMGPALLRSFDTLDVVVSGEADHVIVPLIEKLRAHESVGGLPGVHARSSHRVNGISCPPLAAISNRITASTNPSPTMDHLPIPDFDDYFHQIERHKLKVGIKLPIEASRGCWWGQKHLCTFCGLNGETLTFRAKSPQRVLDEIVAQHQKYRLKHFMAVDNILDMGYFNSVLPTLESLHERFGITFFYETKSNLRFEHIAALRRAGIVEVQPGIESFSDHVLQLMDKGTTGLNQVRFLRDCVSERVETRYGVLWGNPGETPEDYSRMTALIPFISHLPPPKYVVPVMLQRFSPYFLSPGRYGIRNVRHAPIYDVMFADSLLEYEQIAYNFCFEHSFDVDVALKDEIDTFLAAVARWKAQYRPFTLIATDVDHSLIIVDRRGRDPSVFSLSGLEKEILVFCETPRKETEIVRTFSGTNVAVLGQTLNEFVAQKLLVRWDDSPSARYLALPARTGLDILDKVLSSYETGDRVTSARSLEVLS
jgi:ribosomal peptide maturation radical SAM protein 1